LSLLALFSLFFFSFSISVVFVILVVVLVLLPFSLFFRCECCVTSSIFLSLFPVRSCVLFIFKRPTKSPFTNCSFAVTRLTNKRILKYLSERSPSLSLSLSRLSKLQNQIRPPQALLRSDAANQPLKRSSFPLPLSPTHPHPHPHPTKTPRSPPH